MLIGLSGKKRVGKDTLGYALIRELDFHRFAFADAVKQAALEINPTVLSADGSQHLPLNEVFHRCGNSFEGIKNDPDWDGAVRQFLQNMGSVMATREHTIWAGPVVRDASAWVRDTGRGAVITDVRFPWEVDLIRSAGGVIVRVFRSDWPDHLHEDSHISETLLDDMVPDAYFDSSPLDDTFTERAVAMVENLTARREEQLTSGVWFEA